MNGFALIFRPDTNVVEVNPLTSDPPLKLLQEAVGGLIEAVPDFHTIELRGTILPCVAYCNEEGKLNGLPFNLAATQAWHYALLRKGAGGLLDKDGTPIDVLCGPVILIAGDDAFLHCHITGEDDDVAVDFALWREDHGN
jgi:hypothetical protein